MSVHGNIMQRTQCPDCASRGGDTSHDNLNVYEDGYAKCFSCNFFEYDRKVQTNGVPLKKKEPKPFVEDVVYTDLKKRGIKEDTCRRYGYGIGKIYEQTVQVAAYRDDHGNLLGQKLKFANKQYMWTGSSTRRFFGQHLFSSGKMLAISEGEIDCLSLAQVLGKAGQVVSLPSGAGYNKTKGVIEDNLQYLQRFDEIILFMDDDEEGHASIQAFADVIPSQCKVAQYPAGYKDCNDMLVAGMEAEIKQAFWNAVPLNSDDDIKSGDDYTFEEFCKAAPVGYSLPHPGLQEALGGLRKQELTLLSAGSGIGKSSLAREWAFHLMRKHKLKMGNIFMEETDTKSFQAYIAMAANIKLAEMRKEDPSIHVSEEVFNEIKAEFKGQWEFAQQSSAWDFDTLLKKIEYMAVTKKCDFIILDHISMAVASIQTADERKAIDLLMSHLYQIVNRTGVGIIAIVHLRKSDGEKDWNTGLIPGANALRGSAGLAQMSFNIVTASRNATDENERLNTYLHLQKCREWGENAGFCTDKLHFNTVTGRLDPVEKFPECPGTGKATKPQSTFDPITNEDF